MPWNLRSRNLRGNDRDPLGKTARKAGALYLVMGIGTAFGMGVVDPMLRASTDGVTVAGAIQSSRALVLAGLASTSLGMIAMLFLAGVLFDLFEAVDRARARLLVVFVVVGVSITLLNMSNLLVALELSRDDGLAFGLEPVQRIGLMMTFLAAYRFGGLMAGFLWGLWLLPFGLLILRSGFAPKFLGILMIVGCFPYVLHSIARLFFPSFGELAARSLLLPTIGELGTIAWFLLKGPTDLRRSAA